MPATFKPAATAASQEASATIQMLQSARPSMSMVEVECTAPAQNPTTAAASLKESAGQEA